MAFSNKSSEANGVDDKIDLPPSSSVRAPEPFCFPLNYYLFKLNIPEYRSPPDRFEKSLSEHHSVLKEQHFLMSINMSIIADILDTVLIEDHH